MLILCDSMKHAYFQGFDPLFKPHTKKTHWAFGWFKSGTYGSEYETDMYPQNECDVIYIMYKLDDITFCYNYPGGKGGLGNEKLIATCGIAVSCQDSMVTTRSTMK